MVVKNKQRTRNMYSCMNLPQTGLVDKSATPALIITHARARTLARTLARTHTHTHKHIHAHTRTHARTHALKCSNRRCKLIHSLNSL